MGVTLVVDGGTAITGSSTVLRPLFDEIAFSNGFTSVTPRFMLDDISVTTNVPEPATAAFAVLAGLGLLRRRRLSRC